MDNSSECIICGHELTAQSSIEHGMGPECYSAYRSALINALFSVDGNNLIYNWLIQVEVYKRVFVEKFKDTKFRKEFKKSFYQSICERERISKKQLSIMVDWLFNAGVDLKSIEEEIADKKKDFLEKGTKDMKITSAAIESARKEIRNKKYV